MFLGKENCENINVLFINSNQAFQLPFKFLIWIVGIAQSFKSCSVGGKATLTVMPHPIFLLVRRSLYVY